VRIARPLVIAALAASLVAAGGTAASASTTSPQHFRYGQESFVLTTNSPSSTPTYWASAYGVFYGQGVFVTLPSPPSPTFLAAHFYTRGGFGSFFVTAYDNGTSNSYQNTYTCRATYTSYGNFYTIKYGTGTLWGLRGWGWYSVFSVQTFPRSWTSPWSWTCNFNLSPISTFTIIRASGPVFLPWHHW